MLCLYLITIFLFSRKRLRLIVTALTAITAENRMVEENTVIVVYRTITLTCAQARVGLSELVYHRYRSKIASAIDAHTLTGFC